VLRSGSKSAAAAALLLDMLKGLVPVLLVRLYGEAWGLGDGTAAWVGVAAFLGHLYPLYFGLKGDKGVATAAGVLFALNPWLGLATLATWLIIALFFRYSSLAAVVSAVFAPFYNVLLFGLGPTALPVILVGLLLIYRHEGNIRKLIAGQETRIGQKAGQAASAGPAHQGGHGGRKHGAGKGGR